MTMLVFKPHLLLVFVELPAHPFLVLVRYHVVEPDDFELAGRTQNPLEVLDEGFVVSDDCLDDALLADRPVVLKRVKASPDQIVGVLPAS